MSGGHDFDQEREQAHGHGHKQGFEHEALRHLDRIADALDKAHKTASQADVARLAQAMQDGFRDLRLGLQEDLKHAEERIMAQTTEQLTGVKGILVGVATKVDNIAADVKKQAELIEQLQNMPPGWTAEDQALLDEIQGLGTSILTNTTAIDDATEGPIFQPVEPPPAVPETPMELSARIQRNESRNKGVAGLSKGQNFPGETSAQRQQREQAQADEDQRRNR